MNHYPQITLEKQMNTKKRSLNSMIGRKVIIRTYSAGVWFGVLDQKSGDEVILTSARRMWQWWAAESISLSAVAIHGIKHEKSKIVEPVESVWLEAIEILPCTNKAIGSLEGAPYVQAV
ncbi:MAG: hypothetical protein GY799_25285 [Desulfobulbaceae bacterium]|nr:hypothetical protein [Desulfobulbaceae bacterium]